MNHFVIFLTTALSGTIITMSTNSWWVGWLGMEINLLGFMILLMNNNSNESSLKYFIIQSLSSVILISSALLMENFSANKMQILVSMAIFLKLGTAPLHFWLPVMVENISNYQLMFLLTWQKLAPLYLMFSLPLQPITIIFIMSSLVMGAVNSMNELRMFTLMTYSSMNHTGWMLLSMLCNELTSILYIFLYTILIMAMLTPINSKNNQMCWLLKNSNKYIIFLNLLSLGGLPPFTGFMMKWMLMSEIYFMLNNFMNIIIMLTSMMLLYFYLRISTNSFFKNELYLLHLNKNKQENVLIFSMINMISFYMMLIYVFSMKVHSAFNWKEL